jgi:hypothetical protein
MTPGELPDPVAVAVIVARHFEQLGIAYVIGGSFASSLHGEPRSTNDVDLVANLDEESAGRFTDLLGDAFYADKEVAIEAARAGGSFNIVHMNTAIKVDVFVARFDALDRERLRRRQVVHLDSTEGPAALYVDTAEDIILRKLEWYRRGGETSDRQWRDVVAVLSAQARLDDVYLDAWAKTLDVENLLHRARVESAST